MSGLTVSALKLVCKEFFMCTGMHEFERYSTVKFKFSALTYFLGSISFFELSVFPSSFLIIFEVQSTVEHSGPFKSGC